METRGKIANVCLSTTGTAEESGLGAKVRLADCLKAMTVVDSLCIDTPGHFPPLPVARPTVCAQGIILHRNYWEWAGAV